MVQPLTPCLPRSPASCHQMVILVVGMAAVMAASVCQILEAGMAAVVAASASVCKWRHLIGAPYKRLLVAMIPPTIMVGRALLGRLRRSLLPDKVCACDGEESPEEGLSRGAQRRAEELHRGGGGRGRSSERGGKQTSPGGDSGDGSCVPRHPPIRAQALPLALSSPPPNLSRPAPPPPLLDSLPCHPSLPCTP